LRRKVRAREEDRRKFVDLLLGRRQGRAQAVPDREAGDFRVADRDRDVGEGRLGPGADQEMRLGEEENRGYAVGHVLAPGLTLRMRACLLGHLSHRAQ
jgi:hypothetical protein